MQSAVARRNTAKASVGVYLLDQLLGQSEDSAVATESASATQFFVADEAQSARRDLVELAIGYTLILATVWTANPTQRFFFWLSCLWIIATSWTRHDGWKALGLGLTGLYRSLWIVGVALLGAWLAVYSASGMHTLHRLHGSTPLLTHGWGYMVWAVMQQFILQGYFLLRLLRLLPGKAAPVVAAAGMFALAHLPNPVLTPITFVWGITACILFLRYRNIYALGLAHGILGLCVAITVPNSLHHHMRVGIGYHRYHPRDHDRHVGHRNQTDHSVSTEAWVTADAPTRRC